MRALGTPTKGNPLFAVGELDDNGELDIVPAGDAQPLFASREVAADVARARACLPSCLRASSLACVRVA